MSRRVFVSNIPVRACVDGWVTVPDDTEPEDLSAAVGDPARRHEIVLKVMPQDFCNESGPRVPHPIMLRIQAFAATAIVRCDKPKTLQKQWEKRLAEGRGSHLFAADAVKDKCIDEITQAFKKSSAASLQWARDDLKRSVFKAHELLPHDEVETIIREALVEYVLKQ